MAVRNVFSRMTLMTTRELPNTCNIRATNPWNSLELTPDSLFVGILSKGVKGLIWFWARRLLSTTPTLCFKEIQVSTKIRVLPSGTFSYTRDFAIGLSLQRYEVFNNGAT